MKFLRNAQYFSIQTSAALLLVLLIVISYLIDSAISTKRHNNVSVDSRMACLDKDQPNDLQELHVAILRNNQKEVEKVINDNPHIVNMFYERVSPLFLAVTEDDIDIAKLLLKYGADPNMVGSEIFDYPLLEAASRGNSEMVDLLLAYGAQVNFQDPLAQSSALHHACSSGKLNTARALIIQGATVDIQDYSGDTPLMSAVQYRKVNLIRLLLAHGANIHCKNILGDTPFSKAPPEIKLIMMLPINSKKSVRQCAP